MPRPPRIVLLDASTLDAGDIDFGPLREIGPVELHPTTAPADTAARIGGADVVLTNKVVLDRETIAGAEALKLIAVCATGVNNIDLDAAREAGVAVCNVAGYSTESVAQHALALLLNLATGVARHASELSLWPESPIFTRLGYPIRELAGSTMGIVGAGEIGCRVGELAAALGMNIQVLARPGSLTDRHPEWPRLDAGEFFATSDAVSLHCPLTDANAGMMDARTLGAMPAGSYLINTARGGLVDEPALADALQSGHLGGAGLDVLSAEPPPADHPLLDPAIPNLLITPHTAWSSPAARRRLLDGVVTNIRTFLAGSPTNRVV